MLDVLLVSLGSTGGLRAADAELLASLRRAGARAGIAQARPPRQLRTMALTDLAWALAARRATREALAREPAGALIYSTTTAALLWPRPGAVRFDALASANRPGRHGLWQRPLERRRLGQATLLLPQSEGALFESPSAEAGKADPRVLVLPVPVEPSVATSARRTGTDEAAAPGATRRDVDAITYAANPAKKGLDVLLAAWARARRPDERLCVAGVSERDLREGGYALPAEGVDVVGALAPEEYRALLRRSRVYACAARREDYGLAQLEALADGCRLVTVPSPGPYVALPIARRLDPRLVGDNLAGMLRIALDAEDDYGERALRAIEPFRRAAVDSVVATQLLPRLLR